MLSVSNKFNMLHVVIMKVVKLSVVAPLRELSQD